MKLILVFIFGMLSFSASAQWYRIDLKLKKPVHLPPINSELGHRVAHFPVIVLNNITPEISDTTPPDQFDHSRYIVKAEEAIMIKTAQHNMHYGIYADASYNFSDLAQIYIRQNRFSEAKWYLLQSVSLSRQQNDHKHTVSNLIELAMVKANMGDYVQAQQDLTEAQGIAGTKGFQDDLAVIEQKMLYLKQNKVSPPKPGLRYADGEQANTKVN
jgi:hypothetical protein